MDDDEWNDESFGFSKDKGNPDNYKPDDIHYVGEDKAVIDWNPDWISEYRELGDYDPRIDNVDGDINE